MVTLMHWVENKQLHLNNYTDTERYLLGMTECQPCFFATFGPTTFEYCIPLHNIIIVCAQLSGKFSQNHTAYTWLTFQINNKRISKCTRAPSLIRTIHSLRNWMFQHTPRSACAWVTCVCACVHVYL